jgi:hypothetical protein
MFKDNKLRLLMTLVGFSRLGEVHDPDATWIIPHSLTSEQLQQAIDLIRKYEFDPPVYEDGKQPEDLLRSKTSAARRSTRRVDFDDDDDNEDGVDKILVSMVLMPPRHGNPTPRERNSSAVSGLVRRLSSTTKKRTVGLQHVSKRRSKSWKRRKVQRSFTTRTTKKTRRKMQHSLPVRKHSAKR